MSVGPPGGAVEGARQDLGRKILVADPMGSGKPPPPASLGAIFEPLAAGLEHGLRKTRTAPVPIPPVVAALPPGWPADPLPGSD